MTEPAAAGQVPRPPVAPAERVVKWAVRALWAALPLTAGPAAADLLDGAAPAVQVVASLGLWAAWAVGVLASAVALPVSLTALRLLAPAAVALLVLAAVRGHGSALGVGWTTVAAGWVFAPQFGAVCVNGPAYPNERRFLLRAPAAVLFGALPVAWVAAVAGAAAGPLLLARGRWVAGGVALAAGAPLAAVLARGLHDLSRRWLVFVPAGVVLHDPLTITDPVLLRRRSVRRMGPALRGSPAVDLSQSAPGLALAVELTEPVELTRVRPGRRTGDPVSAGAVVVTPTRPGEVLAEARRRRFPVRTGGGA